MIYVFDTNILIHYIRQSPVMDEVNEKFDPLGPGNECWLSAVSIGEIYAIAIQNKWGEKNLQKLDAALERFLIADINVKELLIRYAEIDSFSQGRYLAQPSTITARNMGKNDLWIAATTSVLNATLITTDKDFDHLDNIYISLARVQYTK